MNPMFVLAELHAQGSLHWLAYSALPDAPVLPANSRRRFARRRPTDTPSSSRRPSPAPARRGQARPGRPAVRGA